MINKINHGIGKIGEEIVFPWVSHTWGDVVYNLFEYRYTTLVDLKLMRGKEYHMQDVCDFALASVDVITEDEEWLFAEVKTVCNYDMTVKGVGQITLDRYSAFCKRLSYLVEHGQIPPRVLYMLFVVNEEGIWSANMHDALQSKADRKTGDWRPYALTQDKDDIFHGNPIGGCDLGTGDSMRVRAACDNARMARELEAIKAKKYGTKNV